jgi:phosphoesterase RecJ-like protein
VIDHHPDPRIWWDVEYKDVSASSVCERLYELISWDKILSAYLDQHVATYLLMWVMTDTGNFVYEKDSRRTFKAALGLLDAWANKPFLVDGLYRHMKKEVLELWSLVWSRIQTKGHVMSMRYTEQELDTYGLEKGDLSKVLSIASSIEWNRVIVVVRSVGSMLKWSLRSKWWIPWEFDVSAICRAVLGGGWHRNASWFTLPATGTIVDQLSKIVDMINTYIDTNHQQ